MLSSVPPIEVALVLSQTTAVKHSWSSTALTWQRQSLRRRPGPLGRGLAMLTACASLAACHWVRTGDPAPVRPVAASQIKAVGECATTASCHDSVDMVAMGVSGFLFIPWRDSTQLVMTPPSYTNPTLWWTVFGNWLFGSSSNDARIARRLRDLPAAGPERLSRVRAVLVGHGHYDHVMDLPPLARALPNAVVYGSRSVVNTLNAVPEFRGASQAPSRLVSVDSLAGVTADQPGRDIPVGDMVRVRAIAWEHAPNFGTHVIARGTVESARSTLPRGLFGWKLGRVYAYAIDLLDRDGHVGSRIVVHDAGASPEVVRRAVRVIGTMPSARTTVVVITAANFDQEPSYPDILLASLAPQHVLLGHWEDFFRSPEKEERVARGIRGQRLIDVVQRYQGDRWTALRAGATLRVRY
ncbi:MBL fold metallo-hydrolase [Gemmatimonas groenlandica]|uniref:MBL fold metallo-hydrolase n=1 Tax=Gemmatimonas groenlandica TaxID=2732249 RepID=A0A6M4IR27_9BACT|nr:MBL fold metallo-hydrolase [Gemmatimonas groenlandica]QJR35836.1 MBL fold metallo-hydrolase [Gemmatimonas groenlandica]